MSRNKVKNYDVTNLPRQVQLVINSVNYYLITASCLPDLNRREQSMGRTPQLIRS